jgi:hypothetical protein
MQVKKAGFSKLPSLGAESMKKDEEETKIVWQNNFNYLPLPTDGTSFQLYAAKCEYVAFLRELLC